MSILIKLDPSFLMLENSFFILLWISKWKFRKNLILVLNHFIERLHFWFAFMIKWFTFLYCNLMLKRHCTFSNRFIWACKFLLLNFSLVFLSNKSKICFLNFLRFLMVINTWCSKFLIWLNRPNYWSSK